MKTAKHVIVAGLQPKTTNVALRGPQSSVVPSLRRRAASKYRTLQNTTFRQTQLYTVFGVDFLRIVDHNQIITLASIQQKQIQLTKVYNIRNSAFTEAKNDLIESQVHALALRIDEDPRISKINKILNFQNWTVINGVPCLHFNAEGSYGRHYQNKNLSSTIMKVLNVFLEENKDLINNMFTLKLEATESEHCIPKYYLEGTNLNREDSHTYQIGKKPHKAKTSNIDLMLPPTIKSLPEAFIYFGDQTLAFLQQLEVDGKLTESVENMGIFRTSIRECIKADIEDFQGTTIAASALDYPGQIKASMIGAKDCRNFTRMLVRTPDSDLNAKACINIVKECMNRSKVRAAYISQGLHMFPADSPAHQTQSNEAEDFVYYLVKLATKAYSKFPELLTDTQFADDFQAFKDLMNQKGEYNTILASPEYAEFREVLQNPEDRLNLIPRTAKNFIFKEKK